ncbi:DNAH6, partial [Symbiodinium necroappetens]
MSFSHAVACASWILLAFVFWPMSWMGSIFRHGRLGDLRNVSAADTLRRRTSSPTGHTVACLVTGRTRAGEVGGIRAYMADVTAQADLFVCADPEDAGAMVLANFSNLVSYRTSSEDGGYPSDLQGVNVIVAQWWRLQQCWKLVQEHEERHRFRYSFYMKTQPDCHRYNACYPCLDTYKAALDKHGAGLDNVFFANSDHIFGGSRRGFERAATMMSRIESDYFGKTLTTYYPLDWDLVLRSEWNGQLHWAGIVFPRDVLDPEHCCSRQDLENKLAKLHEFSKNGTPVDGKVCNLKGDCSRGRNGTHEGLSSYRYAPDSVPFDSEVSFLLDMLRGGIEMHELRSLSKNLTRAEHNRTGLYPVLSPSGHKVACIISGKIRGSDRKTFDDKAKAQMKEVTAGTDLFVCADQEDHIEEHFQNFSNLVQYRTAEDDGGYKADLKNIDQPKRDHEPGTPPGMKAIQWWRLQQCWRLVQQYEERFDFRYSFYYKTRTDCDTRGGCYPCLGTYEAATKKYGAQLDKVFFANSDRVFGGSRRGFERAATFMSRIESDYFRKTLTTYYPLDWDLVLRS